VPARTSVVGKPGANPLQNQFDPHRNLVWPCRGFSVLALLVLVVAALQQQLQVPKIWGTFLALFGFVNCVKRKLCIDKGSSRFELCCRIHRE